MPPPAHSPGGRAIPAAMGGFLRAHGHWDQAAALHQIAVTVHARPVIGPPTPAPSSSSASCNTWLATNRPPPPATSRR